ncbi:hypothetical protein BKA67DRAFT_156041 [Truncatella angustata]|uniref:Uncharacterized protein n=1 Tax=Truncatella angustata TaxID=152316 RepID=A0A9P8ZZQ2_9PEZI|nr:uncharacterized protein BKA67DRAFT_156041 [Truncatella angustata]KAH6656433.1 hypothetical protein BKA67DRAFT_156041 [Truncatella angustata]
MNQSLSDDTLWSDWSNSQDSGFEGGWKEIYAEAGGKADSMTLFAELLRLYREGMAQELAAAIEAFVDFTEHQPDAYGSEVAEANDFRTDKIAPLVDLWNPFGPEEAAYVATVAQHLWPSAFDPSFLQQRRARVLLQALGLLDIDFVREARRPVFRSWGQKPQVVQMVDCLTGRQCSECRHLIRSFHFYECQNGCKDEDGHIDMFKVFPKESGPRGTARYISPEYHWYSARKAFDMRQYRVCPACLPKSSHPRSHLRALRGYTKAGDQVALGFARELDLWEDDLDGRFMESLGVNALDKLASVNRLFAKTSSRHFFPAGNAHCALMFGPLLIENGMTRHPGGASISRRPLVNFTASSNADLQEFMSEPTDYHPYKGKSEVLHQRHLSYAANKHLYQADLPIRARRFVTCRKQVSGGLFTNYCDRFAIDEALIVLEFTKMAESWQTIKIDRTQTQKEYRAQLLQRGQYLAELIFETFGEEIRRSLLFFASRLHKEVKLQYNRLSNNCQDFCNELLIGHDKWDSMFNRIYPPVPVNLEQNENTYCIRYMMSFASRMLHPLDEMPFVDPVASSTQLYDTFGHNDADILDHIANIRYKEDPEGSGLTMPDSCHDPFLLKGRDTTCFQNSR